MATNTEKLENIAINIAQLSTDFAIVKKQSADMYKLFITGNGMKPIMELVRNHEDWICTQKQDAADKEIRIKEFSWKVAFEVTKQIVIWLLLAIALWLGLTN